MPDVVVLGGGIAGCAAGARLAGAGHSVTIFERDPVYTDKVRGEGSARAEPRPAWAWTDATSRSSCRAATTGLVFMSAAPS
jgi:2-polyprenyl-6-methoxyphenol hydroxylase-like FAD-dependent oxidoreductase